MYPETKKLDKKDRIITICKINSSDTYINTIAGKGLYSKEDFKEEGIDFHYLISGKDEYPQYNNSFTPWLSIIDVIMFNNIDNINKMLNNYSLE